MDKSLSQQLGDYVRNVFDLNKDGRVTVQEFFSALLPNYAVGIVLVVVDLLMLVGEYRVWHVGMTITDQNPFLALGFVLVSGLPFYLSQLMWLYPRATGIQQTIAVLILGSSLYTSAQFGLADLSKTYDVARLVRIVIILTIGYVVALLLYVLSDKSFRLYRASVRAKDNARFQGEMNQQMQSVLADLRRSLEEQRRLEQEFGTDAVKAHMEMFGFSQDKKGKQNKPALPAPQDKQPDHHPQNNSKPAPEPANPTNPPTPQG